MFYDELKVSIKDGWQEENHKLRNPVGTEKL